MLNSTLAIDPDDLHLHPSAHGSGNVRNEILVGTAPPRLYPQQSSEQDECEHQSRCSAYALVSLMLVGGGHGHVGATSLWANVRARRGREKRKYVMALSGSSIVRTQSIACGLAAAPRRHGAHSNRSRRRIVRRSTHQGTSSRRSPSTAS
jgi:hypothetical protein